MFCLYNFYFLHCLSFVLLFYFYFLSNCISTALLYKDYCLTYLMEESRKFSSILDLDYSDKVSDDFINGDLSPHHSFVFDQAI